MDKKNIAISVAIALIFVFFVGYGIEVFHKGEKMETYCPNTLYEITDNATCIKEGGVWSAEDPRAAPIPVKGMCQPPFNCYEKYEQQQSRHDKVVFISSIIIGLLAIVAGVLLRREVVGTGILAGGILVLLYGTIRYWRHADDLLKFVLLGIALGVLIFISYKIIGRKTKNS